MKKIDLAAIVDVEYEFRSVVNSLLKSYKGEWDDAVHDSYGQYVAAVQKTSESFGKIHYDVRNDLSTVECTDNVILAVKDTCREANLL